MNERPFPRSKLLASIIAGTLALSYTPHAAAAKPPSTAASAEKPDLAGAKRHYAEGEKKFKAGDFAGALAEFQAANDIKSTPQAERYMGACEDSLGHLREAAAWYDKFLLHVPEKMTAIGDEIRKRLGEIKALPGKVHIDSNPAGAAVSIDGQPMPAPTPADVELSPGAHTIRLTAPGRLPAERAVDVSFASAQTVTADLDAAPPPPPPPEPVAVAPPPAPPPPPPEPRSKVPAFVTGGLAVAAAGVGTVFGVMALQDKSDYDKNPTQATADNGDTHSLIADMAFGVALTFGVTSAVLFLTKDDQQAPPPAAAKESNVGGKVGKNTGVTVAAVPWVSPRAGGAGFLLQF